MRVYVSIFIAAAVITGCTFGPVTYNKAVARQKTQWRPSGTVSEKNGLYFKIISNSPSADSIGLLADRIYQDILADIKLTESLRPFSLYELYLYDSKQEYLEKTGMPEWSGGVFDGGCILLYDHPDANAVLAHEISHLIFWEFFGGQPRGLLWLNEGLAMHEERRLTLGHGAIKDAIRKAQPVLRSGYIPLHQLISRETALDHHETDAHAFYVESWLLTYFLLERGGRVGFYELLKGLKNGLSLEVALWRAFPGKWPNLRALESAFRAEYVLGL